MFNNIFNKSSFGLDIGDDSIKFVELIAEKNGFKVGRYGEHKIPVGVVESGEIMDEKKFKEILLSLKKDIGSRPIHISFLNKRIQNIKKHLSVFKNSGISIKSFERQAEAITRAVIKKGDLGTYLIVDFGKKHSNIFIISGGIVMSGSMLISKTISILRDQVAKDFLYWQTHKSEGENRPLIEKIILCGNEPNLISFSEYLSVGMRNRVEMANVWVNILDTGKNIPEISFEQSLGFASALGVALKNF